MPDRCPNCDYPLEVEGSGTCSECGWRTDEAGALAAAGARGNRLLWHSITIAVLLALAELTLTGVRDVNRAIAYWWWEPGEVIAIALRLLHMLGLLALVVWMHMPRTTARLREVRHRTLVTPRLLVVLILVHVTLRGGVSLVNPAAQRDPQPLFGLVMAGDTKGVARQLRFGMNPNIEYDIAAGNYQRWWRDHPLVVAIYYQHGEIAILLLDAGADPNARDHLGMTPLMWATALSDVSVVEALLAHGADAAAVDENGHTALDTMKTRTDGQREAIVQLIEAAMREQASEAPVEDD